MNEKNSLEDNRSKYEAVKAAMKRLDSAPLQSMLLPKNPSSSLAAAGNVTDRNAVALQGSVQRMRY